MQNLILLHGALGHPAYFNWYAEQLSPFFNVHTPVFAGHGRTALPDAPLTISTYIAQIHSYCADNGLEQVHLFGYSMGGYAALAYAAASPGNVASVLTLATKLDWSPEIAARETVMLQPETVLQKVPRFAASLAGLHGDEQWKTLMKAVDGMLEHLGKCPELTDVVLAGLATKVQLMVGDKDNMVSVEETYTASRKIPGAGLAVLPGTGHPFEKADREMLLLLMTRFFREGKV